MRTRLLDETRARRRACSMCGSGADALASLAGAPLCWSCFNLRYMELGVGA